MTDDTQQRISNLTAQLEAQRLQINELIESSRNIRALNSVPTDLPKFDISRIPDAIRMVPEYNGDQNMLACWLSSVEQKLEVSKKLISETDLPVVLPLWIGIIRDKIHGAANEALTMSQCKLNWDEIKTTLKEHFGDRRDLSAIVTSISYLKQGSRNVSDFYYECKSILASINAKIQLDDRLVACAVVIMESYESMIVNAFIDGLRDNLSPLVRVYQHKTLLSAYQAALSQESAFQRKRERAQLSASNFPPRFQSKNYPAVQDVKRWTVRPNNVPNLQNKNNYPAQNHHIDRNRQDWNSGQQRFSQRPAIKQDPSGQIRANYVNTHEECDLDDSEEVHEECGEYQEEEENLNFLQDTEKQIAE